MPSPHEKPHHYKHKIMAAIIAAAALTSTSLLLCSPTVVIDNDIVQRSFDPTEPASSSNVVADTTIGLGPIKKGAALCAIQKWGLRYIDEWVDFNLAIGFETIYIYDNSDNFELQHWLKTRIDDHGRIVIKHFPGGANQIRAYTECGRFIRGSKSHSWIAFFDIDEFLVVQDQKKYPYIMDFLDTMPEYASGLAVNWFMFGSNQTAYEPKPLTLRCQKRQADVNMHIKTIVRAEAFEKMTNPHFVEYPSGAYHTLDSNGKIVKGPFNENGPSDRIVLHHYRIKSLEEFRSRCARGKADIANTAFDPTEASCMPNISMLELYGNIDCDIFDNKAWELLKERVPRYAALSQLST